MSSLADNQVDATQRKLIAAIVLATLVLLTIVIADLASGGRPDPPKLRAASTLLDGSWRFHSGDDPHWSVANADDSGWETTDMHCFGENLQSSSCRRRRDNGGLQKSLFHPLLPGLGDTIHTSKWQLLPFLAIRFRKVSHRFAGSHSHGRPN